MRRRVGGSALPMGLPAVLLAVLLAVLPVGLLGGCTQPGTTRASVLNESTLPLSVGAWPVGGAPVDPTGERLVSPGAGEAWEFGSSPDATGGVVFRVTPTSGEGPAMRPHSVTVQAPGPYSVRVGGNAARLTFERDPGPGFEQGPPIPDDPRRRGVHDDQPPVNPQR